MDYTNKKNKGKKQLKTPQKLLPSKPLMNFTKHPIQDSHVQQFLVFFQYEKLTLKLGKFKKLFSLFTTFQGLFYSLIYRVESVVLQPFFFFLIGKTGEYIKSAWKMAHQSTHEVYKKAIWQAREKKVKKEPTPQQETQPLEPNLHPDPLTTQKQSNNLTTWVLSPQCSSHFPESAWKTVKVN